MIFILASSYTHFASKDKEARGKENKETRGKENYYHSEFSAVNTVLAAHTTSVKVRDHLLQMTGMLDLKTL